MIGLRLRSHQLVRVPTWEGTQRFPHTHTLKAPFVSRNIFQSPSGCIGIIIHCLGRKLLYRIIMWNLDIDSFWFLKKFTRSKHCSTILLFQCTLELKSASECSTMTLVFFGICVYLYQSKVCWNLNKEFYLNCKPIPLCLILMNLDDGIRHMKSFVHEGLLLAEII